jgi:hypothetical protein
MNRIALASFLITVSAVASLAQQPVIEYGKPEELKGVAKVFIDTGTDMKNRERMLKVFEKEKRKIPDLMIIDSPEGADVILGFAAHIEPYMANIATRPPLGPGVDAPPMRTYREAEKGVGKAFIRKGANHVRILMEFSGSARSNSTPRPSEQFAKAFIREYLKANGGTKK